VTSGLAASLKLAGKELKIPKYVEISVERINGNPIGFTRSAVLPGEGGTTTHVGTSASVAPRSARDLIVTDSGETETIDKNHRIIEDRYVRSEGGEISDDIVLKSLGAREYSYEGTHLGKKVSGHLKTSGPHGLPSSEQMDASVRGMLAEGATTKEVRVETYDPNLDPTAPVVMVIRPVSKKDRTVTMDFGQVHATATVDEFGRGVKAEMPIGPATMTIERVFVGGDP
jgi:hypothetical protein